MQNLASLGRTVRPFPDPEPRRQYQRLDRSAYGILVKLTRPQRPSERVHLLTELAADLRAMSVVHQRAFAAAPIPDEDGRDLAESHLHAALLVALVADAEHAAALGQRRQLVESELEGCAGPVLDRMASQPDPTARGPMLDDLYAAVVDHVGSQAAKAIATLPAPGRRRRVPWWRAVREMHRDRLAGRAALSRGTTAALLAVAYLVPLAGIVVGQRWVAIPCLVVGVYVAWAGWPRRLDPQGAGIETIATVIVAVGLLATGTYIDSASLRIAGGAIVVAVLAGYGRGLLRARRRRTPPTA
ncbi:hypothetical protein [Micromonospora sp. NPDC049662]|uniref:hypothetical protein n=1 Tax=Micromonospora sp. NPDC049662 TaxID=3155397 RepID=UPI00343C8B6F